jgi:hypothetical protein
LKYAPFEALTMSTDGAETERVSVSTYVPAYQRETWAAEAESMGVSRSEYVRLMVQAGRRSFDLDGNGGETAANGASADGDSDPVGRVTKGNPENGGGPGSNPRGRGLEDRVLDLLDSGGYLDWDELVAGLTDDIEDRLDAALDELQSANRVRYSGRNGGYTVVADE